MMDRRFIVVHHPGPAYMPGVTFREQPGVMDHVRHYAAWLEAGKLEMGGPFLDGSGGMMIPVAGIGEDEVREHALADPAVASGLLRCEVKEWFVGMNRER